MREWPCSSREEFSGSRADVLMQRSGPAGNWGFLSVPSRECSEF